MRKSLILLAGLALLALALPIEADGICWNFAGKAGKSANKAAALAGDGAIAWVFAEPAAAQQPYSDPPKQSGKVYSVSFRPGQPGSLELQMPGNKFPVARFLDAGDKDAAITWNGHKITARELMQHLFASREVTCELYPLAERYGAAVRGDFTATDGATAKAARQVTKTTKRTGSCDCGCVSGGECTCADCPCRPAAHPKTRKADDGGPDWTWDEKQDLWWRPAIGWQEQGNAMVPYYSRQPEFYRASGCRSGR